MFSFSCSSATTVSVPSVRPAYTLAPSALSQPTNPPRSDLGSFRSSPTPASARGQGADVLPLREGSSRATRLPSSVARSGTVQSDNGGRSRASLSRGVFVERDALMASGDQSLADYYVDDLDFEYQCLDKMIDLKAVPRGSDSTFLFNEPGQSHFFGPKRLVPDTITFADSLRDPASATKSPFDAREYKRDSFPWSFILNASSLAGQLAIYSTALADILCRAVELEVSEEDLVTVRALILELSAMQFSQVARMQLFAISHSRNVTLRAMGLHDRLNVSAAVRIPKDGEYLFGGKLLESVDTDINMHKRAKEVASRLAKPRRVDEFRRQRPRPLTSFPYCG